MKPTRTAPATLPTPPSSPLPPAPGRGGAAAGAGPDPFLELRALARRDPAAAMAELRRLEQELHAVEGEVLLAAYDQAGWRDEEKVAATLGMARSTLRFLIAPGRRHAEIGPRVAHEKALRGIRSGRPPSATPADPAAP